MFLVGSLRCSGHDRDVRVGAAPEGTAVLIRRKKRSGTYALVRVKAGAVLHASEGDSISIIAGNGRAQCGPCGEPEPERSPARPRKQELEAIPARSRPPGPVPAPGSGTPRPRAAP